MKRTVLSLVAATTLAATGAGLVISPLASASSHGGPIAESHGAVAPAVVTVGSQWTLYQYYGLSAVVCQVLTFDSHGIFTDDQSDVGKWKSSTTKTTLTYTGTSGMGSGKLSTVWTNADNNYSGTFAQTGGNTYGPYALVSGVDPFGKGSC